MRTKNAALFQLQGQFGGRQHFIVRAHRCASPEGFGAFVRFLDRWREPVALSRGQRRGGVTNFIAHCLLLLVHSRSYRRRCVLRILASPAPGLRRMAGTSCLAKVCFSFCFREPFGGCSSHRIAAGANNSTGAKCPLRVHPFGGAAVDLDQSRGQLVICMRGISEENRSGAKSATSSSAGTTSANRSISTRMATVRRT